MLPAAARPYKIVAWFFLFGTVWALTSDPVISFVGSKLPETSLEWFRKFNDLCFVVSAGVLIFFLIRWERRKTGISEEQYRSLFITNPNPMWIFELGTLKFIEVNDAAIQKYGYTRKQFLKMTILDIRPPEDVEKVHDDLLLGEVRSKDETVWRHLSSKGEELHVTVTAHRLIFNKRYCSMVMITDVTGMLRSNQRVEQALATEKLLNDELEKHVIILQHTLSEGRRMAGVIDNIYNMVMIIEEDWSVQWVNRAYTDFTGYTSREIAGRPLSDILSRPDPDGAILQQLSANVRRRQLFISEFVNYKKNGEEYWTQFTLSPILDSDGNLECYISVENVVTEQKMRERHLKSQYEAFRELAWITSHEIRRPVASILSLTELLKNAENAAEQTQCAELLEACATDLDNIIRNSADKINRLEKGVTPEVSFGGVRSDKR